MKSNYGHGVLTPLLLVLLTACVNRPAPSPLDAPGTAAAFSARRLEGLGPELPSPFVGWDRAQWLAVALQLNPRLAEQRVQVAAIAAAERTAAQHPNPTLDLFAEYAVTAARSAAWLYGLSLDFLLQRPGERSRARQAAAVQTAIAQAELADSIWQVRAALRRALLDAASARDETTLLQSLIKQRQGLLATERERAQLGDIAGAQTLDDELDLSRAQQRLRQSQARSVDALARLAAAVGLPLAALDAVPVRWDGWADIGNLTATSSSEWRAEALIARPQIIRALREYDLAEIGLQSEAARRWPQLHVTPGYAWGSNGVREDPFNETANENALGVSFELPLFNRNAGPIGEAIARRKSAGEHLKAVQADLFEQIDRAEGAWPAARQAWQDAQGVAAIADRQCDAELRALGAGAPDRAGVLSAEVAATEAQLLVLQAAYAAELAMAALEDAYRRPLGA